MKMNMKKTPRSLVLVIAMIALLSLLMTACSGKTDDTGLIPSDDTYSFENPQGTLAEPDAGFVIDGILDEEEYQNCQWLKLENTQGGAGVDIAMTSYYGTNGMYIVYDVTESSRIYVNPDRPTYLNSCIEMYLASSNASSMSGNEIFEIDMLPTGDLSIRQRTGKDNWVNVASTDDVMARLGATTKGGPVNTEECTGYNLELFIPWDYLDYVGLDASDMKKDFFYINPVHITSYNYEGTESGTDRYWYSFATQIGSDGWNDVAQYFRFGGKGVIGTVPIVLVPGDNYTISGNDSVIPGMMTTIELKPDAGYAFSSIKVNGEEYIHKVSYNEDGSVMLQLRGQKEGLKISAVTQKVTEGNKNLSGTVVVHKLGGDTLEGVSISYKGPGGEKPIELDAEGKFTLTDLKQGYYTVMVTKNGYAPINRGIYLNCDIETELTLEYQMFRAESGYNWILDDQNDGVLKRFGGSGKILSEDSFDKFGVKASFKYDTDLAAMSNGDTFLQQRSGIQLKFGNGKYWRVDLMNENGVFKVQYAKHNDSTLFSWKTVHELTKEEIAQYQSEDGIEMSILRDENYVWVCLNDRPVAIEVLDTEYAELPAQIGFEGWIANPEIEEMEYNLFQDFDRNLRNFYFTTNTQWDISRQLEGVLTLPKGGSAAIPFYGKYTDVDITLTGVKEHDTTGKKPGRTDILLEFDTNGNGTADKSVSFGIVCTDPATKTCWVQTLGNADNYIPATRIKGLYKLSAWEAEKYLNGSGVDLRVVRKGTEVYVFVEGEEVAIWDLTQNYSGVTAKSPATVSVRHYDAKGAVALGFEITGNVGHIQINKIFKDNDNWNLTKQNQGTVTVDGVTKTKGVVSLPGGGTDTSLQFFKRYQNIDLTVTAKENDTTGKKPGRTDILFEFDINNDDTMDKNVSFGIVQLSGGRCVIQTLGWPDKHIPAKRMNEIYELDYAETLKYKSEGVDLRVVRYGTNTYIYLDGKQVAVFDLTQNNSGVKANTKATMFLRHYDAVANEIVIPFTVTDQVTEPEVVPLPKPVFKPNFKWDLSKQNQDTVTVNGVEALKGVASLPGGGTNAVVFYDQFADIDLTVTAKENAADGAARGRTDVLLEFENGKNISFGVLCVDEKTGDCWIQALNSANDTANAGKYIINRGKGFYKLTAEETARYKGDGIDLRIVRNETTVLMFLDGKQVAVCDLNQNNSGVTADMKATVSLRHYDAVADRVDIPFTVTDTLSKVEIVNESVEGAVTTQVQDYVIGATIVVVAKENDHYVSALTVDGVDVAVNNDGTYSFTATKSSYTINGTSAQRVFKNNSKWDLTKQNQGTITVDGVDKVKGTVTLPGAGTDTSLQLYKKYQNVDITVTAKENDTAGNKFGRTDILFEFDLDNDGAMDKNVSFGIVQQSGGRCVIQTLGWPDMHIPVIRTNDLYVLDYAETLKYKNEGVDLRVVRYGTYAYIYLDGKQVAVFDLGQNNSGVKADSEAAMFVRHYDAIANEIVIPFTVTDQVARPAVVPLPKSVFKPNFKWDLSQQNQGTVTVNGVEALKGVASLPGGGTNAVVFYDQFADIDLTVTAKENDATGKKPGRTDVLFEFENGKNISFGVLCTNTSTGECWIQALNSANDTVNAGKFIVNRGKGFYKLTAEEAAKYSGEGVDLRIVRNGTTVLMFLDGKQVAVCDLNQNNSGVTADMKATVSLRHYDAIADRVDIPFTVTDALTKVTITDKSVGGKVVADRDTYVVGAEVVLMADAEGYNLVSLKVDNQDVQVNADGTYRFIATKADYTVEGTFKKAIFASGFDMDLWDLSGQYNGVVVLPNGGGGTPSPLQFYKKYGDVGLSLTVRDYPDEGNTYARTDVEFVFDNNQTVTFGVAYSSGYYRVQTRGGTLLDWKTPYFITDENLINDFVVTTEELSSGNPGGLDFRVVRYGTEFYLYLDGTMVKGYDFGDKIAADTPVTVYLRHYDDVGQRVEIPFKVTEDVTISDSDLRLFSNKEPVTDYAYSFAVLPDTQIVAENDVNNGEANLAKLFDWIVANKSSKNIQYVFGLGDITDNNNAAEWSLAQTQFEKLGTAGIPYSAVRGNHDLSWYSKDKEDANYYTDDYQNYIGTPAYKAQFEGFYNKNNVANSWRTFTVGEVEYLLFTLDYGANDAVLNWASDIIELHPNHKVIITTHAYLYRDGTTLDAGDTVPPSTTGGKNDGDDMWNKLVAQHKNIVLVMCGHDPSESIVVNRSTGVNGNVVTSMLIDAQDVEAQEGSMGMVAMLYFSADGKKVQVEYYSTAKEKYFMSSNQFSLELDMEGNAGIDSIPVFVSNAKWDLSKQNQGTETVDGVKKIKGTVSLPGGGTNTTLQFLKKYQNIDLTVTAKENYTTEGNFGRTDILFEFDLNSDGTMDKNVSFGIIQSNDGRCVVQTLGWQDKHIPEKRTNTLYELDYAETLKYKSEGVDLRVVRYGTNAYIYLDGKQVAVFDLTQNNSGVKADSKATMFLRHYDAVANEIVIPFTVTDQVTEPAVVPLPKPVFKPNHKWDLSKQDQGIASLPGGGTNAVAFYDQFTDIDLTITAKENKAATAANGGRTDILFEFENGKNVSFGIVKWSATSSCIIETLGNSTNHIPENRKNTLYTLNADETAAYLADGVELRVVRNGTNVHVFCEGKLVNTFNLAQNDSGVTADMKATVSLRHYDAIADRVDIPFAVTDQLAVTITDTSSNGAVVDTNRSYKIGDTVTLSSKTEDGYLVSLKVDGVEVTLAANGTYTFTATKASYTVEGVFRTKVFKDNAAWDLSKQNQGTVEEDGVKKIKGTVSLPGGGTNTTLQFLKKYQNIDLTVTAKENDTSGEKPGRTDVLFEFDLNTDGTMDKNVSFGIVQLSDGRCVVQTLGWNEKFIPAKRSNELYELDYAETLKYKSTGVDLRVVRYDADAYIYVDGKQVAVFDLTQNNSGVKADSEATMFLRHYDAVANEIVIPFTVTDQVTKPEVVHPVFKSNYKWDLSKQNQGTVTVDGVKKIQGVASLPGGGTNAVAFYDSFTDIDLTITAKENKAATAANGGRTDILFEFENGKNVSFGIVKWSATSSCIVETLGNSTNHIPATRKNTLYTLDAAETNAYLTDGVELRVVRNGTNVHVFCEGKAVAVFDLTQNGSGVTADMKATVSLRHYDAVADQVDIPFTVTSQLAAVTVETSGSNGTVNTDKDSYKIGDTVTLSTVANDGYYLFGLKVDGAEVTVKNDGTYTFTATKARYTVEGIFRAKLFVDNADAKWDLSKQNQGTVIDDGIEKTQGIATLLNSGGIDVVAFRNKYTNIDLTVTAKENDTSGTKPGRTDVLFEFDNGKNVSFGVTKSGSSYIVQTLGINPGFIPANRYNTLYTLNEAEIEEYLADGVELRVVRSGTNVHVFCAGKLVNTFNLAQNNSGVTANMPAKVSLRHYDAVANRVDIPFTVTDQLAAVTVETSGSNGTVNTDKTSYQIGDTVILSGVAEDGYYLTGMKVDGVEVALNTDGTYSFVAVKANHKVEGIFRAKLFVDNAAWDLSQQNQGTVEEDGVVKTQGIATLNGGGSKTVAFRDPYNYIDLTIKAKDIRTAQNNGNRTDILFEFENGKNVSFGLVKWTNTCIVETLGNSTNHIPANRKNTLYTLNATETEKYVADGVELRVVRIGTNVQVYLEGKLVNTFDLTQNNSGVTADMKATVSLRHYDAIADQVVIPFTVTATEPTVYGTGYVPVSEQVKTTNSFSSIPRTIEVTFNRSSNTTRAILLGNCGGSSNDYFNLECPINENIIYLNLCLGGATYQHSFNTVSIPTGQTVRVTVVLEDTAVKCYVNGVLAQTRTNTNGGNGSKTMAALWESVPKANLSNLWGIGNDLRNYPFIGTIYDIALWSDARTAEEIAGSSIAGIGTAGYQDNLLAAYNFCAGYKLSEANFSKDLSGNGNHLTGTLNVGTSTTAPALTFAAIAMDDLLDEDPSDDATETPADGETTPPAGDSGDGETTPPSGDTGSGETTPPSGDTGGGETTPPSGDSGGGETTPPSGDTGGGETTPPSGDTGGGETTPPAGDSGDGEITPPAGDSGDGETTPPTGDTGGGETTPPTGNGEATPTAGDPGDGGSELEPAA